MSAIAKAIGRPPAYPTKYFGCELGAQTTITNDIFVVNGSHDAEKLQNLLYRFIKQFVLCFICSNPETTLAVANQSIKQTCIACGAEKVLNKQIHRLTTYIINHPPEGNGSSTGSGNNNSCSSNIKSSKSKGGGAGGAGEKNGKSGKEGRKEKLTSNTAAAYVGGNVAPKDEFPASGSGDVDEDGFDEAEFETSAYAQRMRELTDGFSNAVYMSDTKENANIFCKLLKDRKEANSLGHASVQKELVSEAERLGIREKGVLWLSQLLFSENIMAEIKQHRLILLRFCNQNRRAQKYSDFLFLTIIILITNLLSDLTES